MAIEFSQGKRKIIESYTNDDKNFGGNDIDKKILEEIKRRHQELDFSPSDFYTTDAKRQCELAKIKLSTETKAQISFTGPDGQINEILTRKQFEKLIQPMLDKITKILDDFVEKISTSVDGFDEIYLIGGSSNIPAVQDILKNYEFFSGSEFYFPTNKDGLVAKGACKYAQTMEASVSIKTRTIKDIGIAVCPEELRGKIDFKMSQAVMKVLIPNNSQTPIEVTHTVETSADNQEYVVFQIIEGEHRLAQDNAMIGIFLIEDLSPGPAGSVKFDVVSRIDENREITISVINKKDGTKKEFFPVSSYKTQDY